MSPYLVVTIESILKPGCFIKFSWPRVKSQVHFLVSGRPFFGGSPSHIFKTDGFVIVQEPDQSKSGSGLFISAYRGVLRKFQESGKIDLKLYFLT